MHILKRSLLLAGLTAFALTACKDDEPAAPEDTIAVTNITVSPPTITLQSGSSAQVSATVVTNGGTGTIDLGVNWSTSNASVVTVSATGTITAGAAGNATVTATSKANASYAASIAVTVTAPPQAPNALLSFSVTPTAVSVVQGGTATTATIVSTSTGATVSYSSSSSSPNCSVTSSGPNPTITANAVGTCVITITATGSGTGLITNQIAQAIAVTVTPQPTALQSLTVSPTSVAMVPNQTQLVTTQHQAAAGATVSYVNTTSNNLVATVTNGANPTITAVGNGSAQITITATGSGAGLITNSISAIIQVNVQAASVSISALTTCVGGPPCVVTPVNLAGALGQIEATMNISSGNQQIGSVAVFLGTPVGGSCTVGVTYTEAARQIFGVNGAPNAPVTLSINTAEFDANFVPKWINGLNCIQARLSPVNGPNPDASNTIQFTLVNPDVVYFNASTGTTGGNFGLNHTGNSAAQAAGGGAGSTWWRGGFTFRAHPVLYSGAANVTGIRYTSTACNGAGITSVGPNFSATFSCAGVQSGQNISNAVLITYVAGYTLTVSPTTFMTAALPGYVPGQPVYSVVATQEDNVGPVTATPLFSAPGAGGWHGNGSNGVTLPPLIAGTTYSVSATDGGVGGGVPNAGLASLPQINEVTLPQNNVTAANQLPETVTPTPYQLRGTAVNDILGNVGTQSGLTAVFGVDLAVLNANYANRATSAFAAIFGGANGTIYTAAAVTGGVATDWENIDGATDQIAIDAIDSRSGLDNATALKQNIRRAAPGISTVCVGSPAPSTPFAMTTILADNWVQSLGVQLDCGLAAGVRVGEYRWQGYVSDRANNARKPLRGGVTLDSIWIAIDEALPNLTGIGFQTALYTGGQPATYTFSANDDYELKDGQVSLLYQGASGTGVAMNPPVIFPYGAAAFSTGPFSMPFDGTFVNVLNNQPLTINYYIVRYDFTTVAAFVPGPAATGNVAAFTTSEINNSVTANVRDQANQPSGTPLTAPVLSTQIQDRGAAPTWTTMIDFRIITKSGSNVITVQDAAPSSLSTAFCDRVDIYEVLDDGLGVVPAAGMTANDPSIGDSPGDGLRWRSTVTTVPVPGAIPDNGFQRFFNYVSGAHTNTPVLSTGLYVAACVKSGSALLSPLF